MNTIMDTLSHKTLSLHTISRRWINLGGFLACAGLLGFGYYLQFVEHLEPCPLCILQRLCFFTAGVLFATAAWHHPTGWTQRVYAVLLGTVLATGAAIAARHVWLQYFVDADQLACGVGLDYLLEVYSLSETLALILKGTGDCTQIDWSFLGLSIPAWSLMWFIALLTVGVFCNGFRPRTARSP